MPVPLHNIHMAAIYLSIVGRSRKGSIFVQICHLFLHELKKVKIGFFFCPLKKPKRKQSSVPRARTLACRAVRVRHAQPAAGTTSHCRQGPATPVDSFASAVPTVLRSAAHLPWPWPWPLPMREDALLKGADRARIASPGPAASFSSHHHLLHLLLFIHLPGRTRRTAASEIARPRLVPSPLGSAPLTHGENSACSVGLAGGRGLVRPAAAGPLPPSLLPSIALSPRVPSPEGCRRNSDGLSAGFVRRSRHRAQRWRL